MLSFFLGDTEEVIHFLLTTSVILPMFVFKLLREADLLSFVFGGKHELLTFFEVSFQETKVLVLPAKKASNSRR